MEHAETMLLYLNEYRSYMLTYTLGLEMVRDAVERGGAPREMRWKRYQQLMTEPVYSFGETTN
jgi:hypothetical protein